MEKVERIQSEKRLVDLPLDCIAKVIGSTTPKDACRISSTAKMFHYIADSDAVWAHFLPSDYHQLLSRSSSCEFSGDLSKKHTYLRLSGADGLLIDGGTIHFSIERHTGKKRFVIGARSLYIEWGDTPEYWEWAPEPGSRFEDTAVLQWVWWLEIRGRIRAQELSPGTNYGAYLVYKMGDDKYGFIVPAEVSLEVGPGGEARQTRSVYLDPDEEEREEEGDMPDERDDGWMEIEMGEFFVQEENDEKEVEFLLLETKGLSAKGGLIVEGYEVRPKHRI